jgi:hypothetical protein
MSKKQDYVRLLTQLGISSRSANQVGVGVVEEKKEGAAESIGSELEGKYEEMKRSSSMLDAKEWTKNLELAAKSGAFLKYIEADNDMSSQETWTTDELAKAHFANTMRTFAQRFSTAPWTKKEFDSKYDKGSGAQVPLPLFEKPVWMNDGEYGRMRRNDMSPTVYRACDDNVKMTLFGLYLKEGRLTMSTENFDRMTDKETVSKIKACFHWLRCHKTGKLGVQFNKDGTIVRENTNLYVVNNVNGRQMSMRNSAKNQSANRMRWSVSRYIQHHCLEMTMLNTYRENPFPFLQSFEKRGENNIKFSSPLCLVWRDPIQTPLLIDEMPGQNMKFKCLVASGVRNTHIKITYSDSWSKEQKTLERSKTARYMQYARESTLVSNEDRKIVSMVCATKMYQMGLLAEGDVELLFWVAPSGRFEYKGVTGDAYEEKDIANALAEVKALSDDSSNTMIQGFASALLREGEDAEQKKGNFYSSNYANVWAKKVREVNMHALLGQKAIKSSEYAFSTDSSRSATMEEVFLNLSSGEFNKYLDNIRK